MSPTSPAHASTAPSLACGACVNRRTFLAQSTVAAIGAALAGACGDGPTGPGGVETGTANLADYPALAVVGGVARISGTVIAVVRSATSTYRAFSMTCPHRGTTISISGSGFRCPNHGATFSTSGQWTGGQSTSSLRELTASYNADAQTLTVG